MKLTLRQQSLYAASAIFAVAMLFVGRERIAEWLHGPDANGISVNNLLQAKSSIPLHNGDIRVKGPDTYDKVVITGVDEYFHSTSSVGDVIEYYSRALPLLGWVPESSEKTQDGRKAKFCKSGMSLIVDATADGSGSSYYMGLGWTKYRQSTTYCPAAAAAAAAAKGDSVKGDGGN